MVAFYSLTIFTSLISTCVSFKLVRPSKNENLNIASKVDYTGHRIIGVNLTSEAEYWKLHEAVDHKDWDVEIFHEGIPVDVRIGPSHYKHFIRYLNRHNFDWRVKIADVQRLIDADAGHTRLKRSEEPPCNNVTSTGCQDIDGFATQRHILDNFPNLNQIMTWMVEIENQNKDLVDIVDIGHTYEGMPIQVLKICAPSTVQKPKIWVESTIHAREWISLTTAIYLITQLADEYGHDEDITRLMHTYDWYFLLVANPDGYKYSHDHNRFWRKNRSPSNIAGYENCVGTDINRNFPFEWKGDCFKHWIAVCSSSHPCKGSYAGTGPLSELETQAIVNFLQSESGFIASFSLHAFAQLWLLPWSYARHAKPDDFDELVSIARKGASEIMKTNRAIFYAGRAPSLLYPAGGTFMDWAKAEAGIKYSYTLELRDRGRYGYLIPKRYITPIGRETWAGIKTAVLDIANRNNLESNVNQMGGFSFEEDTDK